MHVALAAKTQILQENDNTNFIISIERKYFDRLLTLYVSDYLPDIALFSFRDTFNNILLFISHSEYFRSLWLAAAPQC